MRLAEIIWLTVIQISQKAANEHENLDNED